jgi:hypothetical protein
MLGQRATRFCPASLASLAPCLFRHHYFCLPTSSAPPLKLIHISCLWIFFSACDSVSPLIAHSFPVCYVSQMQLEGDVMSSSLALQITTVETSTHQLTHGWERMLGNGRTSNLETRTAATRSSPRLALPTLHKTKDIYSYNFLFCRTPDEHTMTGW